MTVDNQRQAALEEKIVRVVNRSKKFAIVTHVVDNTVVVVQIQTRKPVQEIAEWCKETIKLIYNKYKDDDARIENLYAALAYQFGDANIIISETNSDGSGSTVHFETTYPSQVITV